MPLLPPKLATVAVAVLIPSFLALPGALAAAAGAAPAPLPAGSPPPPAAVAAAQAAPAPPPLVVFLGDSLTAGLGLAADQAYPALLDRQLRADGLAARVLNAGVSGDTTAGGLRRLPWLLAQHPAVVVIGLGANDGLRATPVASVERNLRDIVAAARKGGAAVLLLGMQIPTNYGPDYAGAFAAVFPRVAHDLGVPLVPFLLAGVGGIPALNQADGIHPTAAGQVKVAGNVKPQLESLLRSLHPGRAAAAPAAGRSPAGHTPGGR